MQQLSDYFCKSNKQWHYYIPITQCIVSSCQKIICSLAYNAADANEVGIKDSKKYFLPRAKNEKYYLLIDKFLCSTN